ncbi:MAG: metal ABC transporter ATP-binding protein [Ancrocorticia sp.]|jgi:zinc transport system ATP-binding protein|nr:metal ABC transporter ATP-binding protein [Ancrocorticia sp.]MCI2177810.1 metal ABC transporter ATP-binding protein [Ancrocorticia sp.]MCI2193489.1 metal ABC transporter ATP-binding protein [Ancrocorticia sp.]MCI2199639.1 metal ABC transporter ATP-binding protein [Ancrocorticia sp.]
MNDLPIEVDDASVVLGNTTILHDINLTVRPGESVAFLGANGSGKSTLVRTILGIYPHATGRVELFGVPVTHRKAVPWNRIGYVPQRVTAGSGVPATALEVVRSGLLGPAKAMWADRGRKAKARAMDALEAVDLADRAHDHVQVFSGGQSQRVLIARALVRNPELLFLDEPLAGIDRESRQSLAELLGKLRAQGLTLVTVLHEMGELEGLVERTVVLADGVITHDGPPLPPDPHDQQHPHHAPKIPIHHAPVLSTEIGGQS